MSPEDFVDVFEQLNLAKARYVVVSGVAVVLHGHVRSVMDLDIVIPAEPDEASCVMQVLSRAGFVSSVPLPLHLVSVVRMFDEDEREVDVFLKYYVPFTEIWETSELMRVGENEVRVISREQLLRVKQMLGREHDLDDVKNLMALSAQDNSRASKV